MLSWTYLTDRLFVVTALCFVLLPEGAMPVSAGDYRAEVLKWRAEHETRFRSPTGWLALTGHYWLKVGDNRLGTTEDCAVKLPGDAAKDVIGIFRVTADKVSWLLTSGGPLLVDSQEVTQADLPIDASVPESDSPTKLEIGSRLKLQLVRRAGRLAIRVRDSESESIRNFHGKSWFDVHEDYRVKATYQRFDIPKIQKIVNVKGDEVESRMSGTLEFQWQGQTVRLDAIEESPSSLFVIFKDRTNGKSTYGAGRFVDVELPSDANGQIVIDFNKAYSPPCAWSPHTLCPLPPKQNHLPFAIESGERNASK